MGWFLYNNNTGLKGVKLQLKKKVAKDLENTN